MSETILEESEKPNGAIVQTVRREDGSEYRRQHAYTCGICGAPGAMNGPTAIMAPVMVGPRPEIMRPPWRVCRRPAIVCAGRTR